MRDIEHIWTIERGRIGEIMDDDERKEIVNRYFGNEIEWEAGETKDGILRILEQTENENVFWGISQKEQHVSLELSMIRSVIMRHEIFFAKGNVHTGYFESDHIPFEIYLRFVKTNNHDAEFNKNFESNNTICLLIVGSKYFSINANISITVEFKDNLTSNINVAQSLAKTKFDFSISSSFFLLSTENTSTNIWYALLLLPLCLSSFCSKAIEYRMQMKIILRSNRNINRPNRVPILKKNSRMSVLFYEISTWILKLSRVWIYTIEIYILSDSSTKTWIEYFIIGGLKLFLILLLVSEFSNQKRRIGVPYHRSMIIDRITGILTTLLIIATYLFFNYNTNLTMDLIFKHSSQFYLIMNIQLLIVAFKNVITKERECPNTKVVIIGWIRSNFTFMYISWCNLMGNEFKDISFLNSIFIQAISIVILRIQAYKGSRFFFPNRCRKRLYNYERNINGTSQLVRFILIIHIDRIIKFFGLDDFNLTRIPEDEWPDCDFCLTKLHLLEINICREESNEIKNKLNGSYMKAPDGYKFHEQCLKQKVLKRYTELGYEKYPDIDAFDD